MLCLQVNYAAPADAGLAACMHSTFAALLEQPAAASCWKALVPFMLGELQDTALPEFVQANMVECLRIMSQVGNLVGCRRSTELSALAGASVGATGDGAGCNVQRTYFQIG